VAMSAAATGEDRAALGHLGGRVDAVGLQDGVAGQAGSGAVADRAVGRHRLGRSERVAPVPHRLTKLPVPLAPGCHHGLLLGLGFRHAAALEHQHIVGRGVPPPPVDASPLLAGRTEPPPWRLILLAQNPVGPRSTAGLRAASCSMTPSLERSCRSISNPWLLTCGSGRRRMYSSWNGLVYSSISHCSARTHHGSPTTWSSSSNRPPPPGAA